jgi:carbon-monoxide dehydrogenase large subunit
MADIEQSVDRVDARAKVTGEALFVADHQFPETLTCLVLRSTHAHARIISIDTVRATSLDGVEKIVTGEDCRDYVINLGIGDQHPLAVDKVRYVGEPVAAVVARDKWTALDAIDAIEVEYEPLPPLLTVADSLAPGAPLIHENQDSYVREGANFESGTNIFHHYKLRKGSVDEAFKHADHIIENTFWMPHRAHAQLEPHGAVAQWSRSGRLEIYSSTQSPFFVRNTLASMFGLASSDVRVRVDYLGGGFGGKSDVTIEPLLAVVAHELPTRWVRLVLSREEVFVGTVVGRGAKVVVKSGFNRDGRIVAEKIRLYFAAGAFGSYAMHVVTAAGYNCNGPYDVENVESDSYGVYTNQPPVGAFRGYSHPETHWAIERQRNYIAKKLGMDPIELRLKNLLRPGSINNLGQEIKEHNGNLSGCIEAVRDRLSKVDFKQFKGDHSNLVVGTGIAALMKSPVMATNSGSSAIIRFNEDGTADVACSGVEMGQGTKTALAQIAAKALLIPLSRIRVKTSIDTDISPYGWQTIGSTTTWKSGMAILDAAQKCVQKIKENAAKVLDRPVEQLDYDGKRVLDRGEPSHSIDAVKVLFGYSEPNGLVVGEPVQAYGTYMPHGLTYTDPETGRGNAAPEYTFGAQGAVVSIDKATGEVNVLMLITAIDAGRVISPVLAKNQIIGGMIMEMGGALREELIYSKEGRMRNNSYTDYKIPASEDVEETDMEVIFFETAEPIGPFGARGIAEHGTVGIAAALGNAISDAVGIEINELPLTNEKIYALLSENGGGGV